MYDYHVHSSFSTDASAPMNEMIDAAIAKGISEIALTDHFDPHYPNPDFPFLIDFPVYYKTLSEAVSRYEGRIKVLKGVEIGIQHGDILAECEAGANAFEYDFIIGAFHSAYNFTLYDNQYFKKRKSKDPFYDYYAYMADCLAKYKAFDVLAHLNVIDRYADCVPDYTPYTDIIENILKTLIENGKGLEFNTSSFRYGMGERTMPAKEILKLYRSLGGEIITVGSDAHNPQDVGYMCIEAVEILKSYGFKYIATYENRKAEFVKI